MGPHTHDQKQLVSYHVVIRRCSLGWRWSLMDYDQRVDTGVEKTWMEAQEKAEAARREYVRRLKEA